MLDLTYALAEPFAMSAVAVARLKLNLAKHYVDNELIVGARPMESNREFDTCS